MAELSGRTAVIVGAGQTDGETMGNGRAVACRFAEAGARCVLVDNRREAAEATAAVVAEVGGEALVVEADVREEADCERVIQEARDFAAAKGGQLDIVHYNVGVSEGDTELGALDAAVWDDLMALNLRGFVLITKHALGVMRPQQAGVIQCISSAAAMASGRNMTYKASKAGLNALVQSLAVDNGRYGIRVNAIMPGLMDTPMAIERRAREQNRSRDDVRAQRDASVPLNKKMGTAWDVANASLFLASDAASYITGVALPVDGGLCARVG